MHGLYHSLGGPCSDIHLGHFKNMDGIKLYSGLAC